MGLLNRGLSSLFCFVPLVSAAILNIDATASIEKSYDYVIVGGGLSGLVVANRLTEDSSVRVLVLEAGVLDDGSFQVMAPGSIGTQDISRYDWNMRTTTQTYLDGKDRSYPLGKAVGGGSITNGMVWTRGARSDFDAWAALGNDGWGWDDLAPYFRKSEKFNTQVSSYGRDDLGVRPDMSVHGTSGPVEVSYSEYFYNPQTEMFLRGCEELGIPLDGEPNDGNITGAGITPQGMTLKNQARATSRTSYLNPVQDRPNLHVATGQRVTRVLFDTTNEDLPKATGVQFAAAAGATVYNVTAKVEVIMAAGAVHTPHLLQVSGVGPEAVVQGLGVDSLVDLPGVGNNLQDHPMISPEYDYTVQGLYTSQNLTGAEGEQRLEEWRTNATGPYTVPLIHAVAFPAFPWVADNSADRINALKNNEIKSVLPDSYDDTLRAGYDAQLQAIIGLLQEDDVAAYELMSTSYGQLTISVMQPLSRGNITASSSSIFDAPKIDPRYCSHDFDCEMIQIGLRFNERLMATKAITPLKPVAQDGFGAGATNEVLQTSLRATLHSDYHPSCTTAMMSRELGGVVDSNLRVYGTTGLRIVDAGIFPMIPGAHLQASVYAVAEKAADIIKKVPANGDQDSETGSGSADGDSNDDGSIDQDKNWPGREWLDEVWKKYREGHNRLHDIISHWDMSHRERHNRFRHHRHHHHRH